MNKVTILTLQGQEIELRALKDEIGYTMKIGDKTYGIRIHLESRKIIDIATAVALLLSNALDTKAALKNENKRLRKGATKARPKTRNRTKSTS